VIEAPISSVRGIYVRRLRAAAGPDARRDEGTPVAENPQGDAVVAPMPIDAAAPSVSPMYTNAVLCRFPGCDHPAQLAPEDADAGSLCFDHLEQLFLRRWRV
jgi:hypothetical protein